MILVAKSLRGTEHTMGSLAASQVCGYRNVRLTSHKHPRKQRIGTFHKRVTQTTHMGLARKLQNGHRNSENSGGLVDSGGQHTSIPQVFPIASVEMICLNCFGSLARSRFYIHTICIYVFVLRWPFKFCSVRID